MSGDVGSAIYSRFCWSLVGLLNVVNFSDLVMTKKWRCHRK